jgi:hypothetical protein
MLTHPDAADPRYKISILIPTHSHVPWQFAIALTNMVGYTIANYAENLAITTHCISQTYIHRARQQLWDEAQEYGAHYVLWLDSDHNFPMDALVRLLARDVPIVGINYSTRCQPLRYVAVKRTQIDNPEEGGAICQTLPDSTGLEEVEALGFGMVLMKIGAIAPTMGGDTLDFGFAGAGEGLSADGQDMVGEDIYFCRKARAAGWKVMVDHDLSKDCTHVGDMEFRLDHVWAYAEEGINVDYNVQRATDSGGELGESERSDEPDS